MNEVVVGCISNAKLQLDHHEVALSLDFSPMEFNINANSIILEKGLQNLIQNSLEAFARQPESKGNQCIIFKTLPKEGNQVQIIYQDNGPGITPEHYNRILEPFFTTKETGQGSGMGLAVLLGIVQDHGGDLEVIPMAENEGAKFCISLPLADEKEKIVQEDKKENGAPPEEIDYEPKNPLPTIIIIDDEPDLVEIVTCYLEDHFTCLPFTDSVKAIKAIEKETPLDMILTD